MTGDLCTPPRLALRSPSARVAEPRVRLPASRASSRARDRRRHAWIPALGLAALLSACQFDPYTTSYAKTEPNLKEIVGSWVATDETLQQLARTPYSAARPRISISTDGSIRMADIPDAWRRPFGRGTGELERFDGSWKLDKHQDSWWGLELERRGWVCSGCLMILGQKPPYRLVIRVGDPDEGAGYEFRKAD